MQGVDRERDQQYAVDSFLFHFSVSFRDLSFGLMPMVPFDPLRFAAAQASPVRAKKCPEIDASSFCNSSIASCSSSRLLGVVFECRLA